MSWNPNRKHRITQQTRKQIWDRDQGTCRTCNTPITGPYECDHITPIAEGGTNHPANLCVRHPKCHREKTLQEIARGKQRRNRRRPPEQHPGRTQPNKGRG